MEKYWKTAEGLGWWPRCCYFGMWIVLDGTIIMNLRLFWRGSSKG